MTRITAPRLKQLCAVCIAALASHAAWSASGEFTFVTGEVTLTKQGGQRSTPARGTAVDPGDRITTGANGMAQPFHHAILPLASAADRRTEIEWGLRDFELRFGRR